MRKSFETMAPAHGAVLLVVMLAAALVIVAAGNVQPAVAQDVIPDEQVEAGQARPADVQPARAGASPDVAPAAARTSYLQWLYGSLGPMYSLIFLALSIALVAVFVMNLLLARRENILPPDLLAGFESLLSAKKYQEAYELAKNDESFLGQVLSAGLARLSTGYSQAIEAMQEVGEEENMKLEHRLSYLALIGTISPMFGLLGTVDGMVRSFDVIAHSTVSPKPSELAGGIAMALVTTLVGLWLAIPAIAAFGLLRNRFDRLVLEVGIVSEGLMRRFQNVPEKRTP